MPLKCMCICTFTYIPVYMGIHIFTYLRLQIYTYLHTCIYRYTYTYVYFCVYMHRDSRRVHPCNPPGVWCQDTQIPNFVNARVPYKQVPASPVSLSAVPPATNWKLTRNPSTVWLNGTTKEKKITIPYTSVKPSAATAKSYIYQKLASITVLLHSQFER